MSDLKRLIQIVVFAWVLITACMNFIKYIDPAREKYKFDSTWKITTGIFVKHSTEPKGGPALFNYDAGSEYITNQGSYHDFDVGGAVLGEKYELRYNPKNVEVYVSIPWRPVFTPDEETGIAIGAISKINDTRSQFNPFPMFVPVANRDSLPRFEVAYKYTVLNILYERYQVLSPANNSLNEQLQVGQKFKVRYWIDHPQRSIIYIDSVIAE